MKAICSAMWSVARHQTVGGRIFNWRRSPSNARVNSAAMSQADLPLRALRASILSSPLSASDVRWPTSVMFITWRTCKPLNSSARRKPSTNR